MNGLPIEDQSAVLLARFNDEMRAYLGLRLRPDVVGAARQEALRAFHQFVPDPDHGLYNQMYAMYTLRLREGITSSRREGALEHVRYRWDNDGKDVVYDGRTSQYYLVSWLNEDSNMATWHGGGPGKGGTTKIQVATMVAEWINSHGVR